MALEPSKIVFEDNHLIAINKEPSDIVQGDKTGDVTLPDEIKQYLKEKYNKPGNVFCGVIHRLDRPTSGIVLFAKTGKALERMNAQFRDKTISKTYVALVEGKTAPEGTLVHFLKKNEKQNKSYVVSEKDGKEARLKYKAIAFYNFYTLVEIELETGRHHQIRCQFAKIGHMVKGDVKYGAKRSNSDGSICLHAKTLKFFHPTTKELHELQVEPPKNENWIQKKGPEGP